MDDGDYSEFDRSLRGRLRRNRVERPIPKWFRPAADSPCGPFFLRHGSIPAFPAQLSPSDPFGMCAFGEDLASKCKEASLGIAPSFAAQPCLAAGPFQELLPPPPTLHPHPGQPNPPLLRHFA